MQKIFPALRSFITSILPWGLFAASSLPLLVLAYLGQFTRFLADDYSTSGVLVTQGFWRAQAFWYQSWSGRFSFTFLVSLVELAGVRIVPWLPFIGLLLWGSALYWTIRQMFAVLGLPIGKLWTGILVNLLIFGVIKSFHEFAQVVFWQTGILTYQISLIFITCAIGIFLKRFYLSDSRPLADWEYFVWCLVFFIGGGFSETWVIVQITLTGLGLVVVALARKHPAKTAALSILFLIFLASWAALLVIAKSPGNHHRNAIMAELSFNLLLSAILSAFWDLPRFLAEWLGSNSALALLLFLGGFAAGCFQSATGKTARLFWTGLGLLFGAYLLLWAAFIPQYAVMGIRPVERALFTPMFLWIWMFVCLGVFTGAFIHQHLWPAWQVAGSWIAQICLALLILWLPVRAAVSYASLAPGLRLYAQLWDERDILLRQASASGEQDVLVDSLRRNPALHSIQTTFWIEGDLQDSPDHWINEAATSYYHLTSISLRR